MIVAGFGFRGTATADSLRDALACCGSPAPDALATAADKAQAPAFKALAATLDLPVHRIPTEALARQATLTRSDASLGARDTGSVAEASALAAAGPGARLLAPRAISGDRMATCALATTQTERTP